MNLESERKIIAIVGPTASGKTAVGVKLAKEFDGEIVSADSRQVYRGLDIGTGKDLAEYGGIPYHLIDIKDPEERFTLFDYLPKARVVIEDIFSRGKMPIIVGGTGLYVQALIEGYQSNQNHKSKIMNRGIYSREQLNDLTLEQLQSILSELNIEAYESLVDIQNPRRLIRAIEKAQEGVEISKQKPDFEVLQIGLDWSREELNKRIDTRVDDRFEQGMLEEVAGLLGSGVDPKWLLSLGLEYRIIAGFLLSKSLSNIPNLKKSKEFLDMKELLKVRSHQYAKRQMTWFKRFPEIVWVKNQSDATAKAENFVHK